MLKALVLATMVLGLASPALAATPCRDAKGHFIKCPPAAAAKPVAKTAHCRDAKGHFAKCGSPGAKPA